MIEDLRRRESAYAPECLTHAVEDDDRLVDRVAEYGQHSRQHGEREFPLEEGEGAEDDDHVVEVGDDGGHREAPLKTGAEIGDDADDDEQQGQCAVLGQLLADLRANEFDTAQAGARRLLVQRTHHRLADLGGVLLGLEWQADHDVAAGAKILDGDIRVARFGQSFTDFFQIGGLGVIHLDQRAAGEFDR